MNRNVEERGFLFLEAALLGCLLVAMTAFIALPRHGAQVLRMETCRTTAVFLAEQELTELELRVRSGERAAGPYGWLGPAEDLEDRPASYTVTGTAQKDGNRGFLLVATIAWQEEGTAKELRLERWVAEHEAS